MAGAGTRLHHACGNRQSSPPLDGVQRCHLSGAGPSSRGGEREERGRGCDSGEESLGARADSAGEWFVASPHCTSLTAVPAPCSYPRAQVPDRLLCIHALMRSLASCLTLDSRLSLCPLLCIHIYTHTYIHGYIHTYIHACMHACIHTCIHTDGQTCIQTDRQTYRQTDIQTYTDRQARTRTIW